jgi:prephenate dehydrogenase
MSEERITIIGVGLIGGSLCSAFKRKNKIVRAVSSESTIRRASEMGIIDEGYDYSRMDDAVRGSQFVFVCTPLLDIGERLSQVMKNADRNSIISDVGSTKKEICGTAEELLPRGVFFVGGHPMAGSEKRGVENANPYLFYDAVYVLTPIRGTPGKVVRRFSSLIGLLGAKVMLLDPDQHDRIAANVSHLPQMLAVLLTNHLAGKNSDLYRNLAAGGFRDMTRIASSDYRIWSDIIRTNRSRIEEALRDFQRELAALVDGLGDEGYLRAAFEQARTERKIIPRYSKGFLKPLFDVRVAVDDEPGELARITNVIFYHGVNIKDIEIVNIREGEGGVLRLGFSEKAEAQAAAAALKGVGYEVSVVE